MLTMLWYRPPSFSYVNVVVMLISKNLRKYSSEASIKTRSTPASSFIGQIAKHTTVKLTIKVQLLVDER